MNLWPFVYTYSEVVSPVTTQDVGGLVIKSKDNDAVTFELVHGLFMCPLNLPMFVRANECIKMIHEASHHTPRWFIWEIQQYMYIKIEFQTSRIIWSFFYLWCIWCWFWDHLNNWLVSSQFDATFGIWWSNICFQWVSTA